jgi:ABC-type antimicrobial peptide transport system permease subunit
VGVVENIKEGSLESEIWPAVYIPFDQSPEDEFSVAVRTLLSDESFIPTLTTSIREIDRDLITSEGATMNDRIINSPSAYMHRSTAWLVGGFAALALVLSVLGLYGVIAYSVSQRTREIGVRVALGAQRGAVYRLILKEAAWLICAGIAAGLFFAVLFASVMRGMLFGVTSWDLPTLSGVAVVLGVSALMASFLPARRAASVNPIEALRSE